ncbi:MAG: amidohydrolase [Propionibacteriaceae bacterium]|nr:amidohydrolase [Propionibacteriaceae bacterium]
MLVRGGHLVDLDDGRSLPADVRVRSGRVVEVGPGLEPAGETVLDARGGWVLPGLWDAHIHVDKYARSAAWVDVSGASGPEEVCARIAVAAASRPDDGRALVAFGYLSASWSRLGTVAELDAVTGERPTVVVAADTHNGWLNSAALATFGLPTCGGPLAENDWFAVFGRLDDLPGAAPDPVQEDAAIAALAARGLTGLVDLEFDAAYRAWPQRVARGQRSLRVRAAVYPHQLDEVLAAGWATGDPLPGGEGLVTMGPLKVIADGSMGTRTAWCCDPYSDAPPGVPHQSGAPNYDPAELHDLMVRAHAGGLTCAVHAIGDRANAMALDAFAATGASGTVEHAQLLRRDDVARFAALGVVASMQPHHLVADRDTAAELWADRTDRLYLTRSVLAAGGTLALGSDAPVSPPDPWLTIATAVSRTGDDRPAWHPAEALTPREALAASVDGRRLVAGAPGDLVVVDADPLAADAAGLAAMGVRWTVCAGRVTHEGA